jgi:uncharacterized integral membrane protein
MVRVNRCSALRDLWHQSTRTQQADRAEVHQGMYKKWQIDDRDVFEVLAYRGGIVGTAVCTALVGQSLAAHLIPLPTAALNASCAIGALSFGTSLYLVHMYVAEIKRTIQACILSCCLVCSIAVVVC